MKVKIGKYPSWFGPYQLCGLLKYVGVSKDKYYALADKIPYAPFEWFHKFQKQKIKIKIDKQDTWNADYTLALIILPVLKLLKEDKLGAPCTDDEDVPENIRSTAAKPKENNWDTDEFHFDRWDYIINEMIWAFENIIDNDWEDQFYSGTSDYKFVDNGDGTSQLVEGPNHTFKVDIEGIKKYGDRISNGTRLFGKYYRSLWS